MDGENISPKSNEYICCFTGHRNIFPEHTEKMPELLDGILEMLIDRGVTVFRAGGAVGFDTVAALKVIEKKKKYPDIKLHLILPCKNQSEKWNDLCKQTYLYTLSQADSITYTADEYTHGCMLKRNRQLVNGSQFCIAYCTTGEGGTAYTLNYAKGRGLRTINIATMF